MSQPNSMKHLLRRADKIINFLQQKKNREKDIKEQNDDIKRRFNLSKSPPSASRDEYEVEDNSLADLSRIQELRRFLKGKANALMDELQEGDTGLQVRLKELEILAELVLDANPKRVLAIRDDIINAYYSGSSLLPFILRLKASQTPLRPV